MSKKHNYTDYSKPQTEVKEEITEDVEIVEEVVEPEVQEEITPKTIVGVVTDCFRLNIRKKPNRIADVVSVVKLADELEIDESESTATWYKVKTTEGAEGYCMKEYVSVN